MLVQCCSRAARLLATSALAALLAACGGPSGAGPNTTEESASATTSTRDRAESPAPAPSPARLQYSQDGAPATFSTTQDVTGATRYTVTTGDGIDGALGVELGDKANAFIKEHYLRRDRWSGGWAVKKVELDSYAHKVTVARATAVEDFLDSYEGWQEQHGLDASQWPRKVRSQLSRGADVYRSFTFNFDGEGDGRTAYVYRAVKKQVFRGKTAWNWQGSWVGKPITFTVFERSRKDGAGSTETFNVFQAWKKVDGEWLVSEAGFNQPS